MSFLFISLAAVPHVHVPVHVITIELTCTYLQFQHSTLQTLSTKKKDKA